MSDDVAVRGLLEEVLPKRGNGSLFPLCLWIVLLNPAAKKVGCLRATEKKYVPIWSG